MNSTPLKQIQGPSGEQNDQKQTGFRQAGGGKTQTFITKLEIVKSNIAYLEEVDYEFYGIEKCNAKTQCRVLQMCCNRELLLVGQHGVDKCLCFILLSWTVCFLVPGLLHTSPSSSSTLR